MSCPIIQQCQTQLASSKHLTQTCCTTIQETADKSMILPLLTECKSKYGILNSLQLGIQETCKLHHLQGSTTSMSISHGIDKVRHLRHHHHGNQLYDAVDQRPMTLTLPTQQLHSRLILLLEAKGSSPIHPLDILMSGMPVTPQIAPINIWT